ncbi:MAG: hypothetical protein EBR88_01350 [Betaproteobacteria bacterium]|nr:hypothetical protein [Betaproteobacteria bacterium]
MHAPRTMTDITPRPTRISPIVLLITVMIIIITALASLYAWRSQVWHGVFAEQARIAQQRRDDDERRRLEDEQQQERIRQIQAQRIIEEQAKRQEAERKRQAEIQEQQRKQNEQEALERRRQEALYQGEVAKLRANIEQLRQRRFQAWTNYFHRETRRIATYWDCRDEANTWTPPPRLYDTGQRHPTFEELAHRCRTNYGFAEPDPPMTPAETEALDGRDEKIRLLALAALIDQAQHMTCTPRRNSPELNCCPDRRCKRYKCHLNCPLLVIKSEEHPARSSYPDRWRRGVDIYQPRRH